MNAPNDGDFDIANQAEEHIQNLREATQQARANSDAISNLMQNSNHPRGFMNTIYNILISWIPNHPFLTIGILGSSFFLGIFIFRRVGGSASSSAVSTVVNVGLPTTLTTTTNQLGFNLLTMRQYIQNMYNNVNNLGTFGGVLFIIRRVFRR